MSEYMETEVIIDHFYVYNNVAVFPINTAINFFPSFVQKLIQTGYNPTSNHKAVFAAVTSNFLITSSNFDTLDLFGCAILNLENKTIEYCTVNSNLTKTKLLDVITYNVKDNIFIDMHISNPNFDVDANFLVKYGFIEPKIITDKIRLKYVYRPPTKLTLMQIKSVVASLKSNVIVLNIFISKMVATTLSKCIKEIYEAAGNLSIIKYLENGAAVVGINSDDILSGNEGSVSLPTKYSPIVFHTHPDHITREFKAFISWPSGQDMMLVALSYLEYRDQLVHLVISPEGIWTIHLTVEFQKLLIKLRTNNAYECSKQILEAILYVFTVFENPRLTESIDVMERHTIGNVYLTTTKNYKLSTLFSDVPQLKDHCSSLKISKDVQLYDVSLIKWKRFSETSDEGVFLSFDYISDIPGGLSPFFFPFN
jgi:hypothetical protein